MAEQRPTATNTEVPQDGASRIIRKLDSIEKKLTLILWFVALPILLMVAYTVLVAIIGLARLR